ncbi:MAG: RNA 3'-terminal phosphate cyclase [Candidatus Diapherotrites archaeon]
MAEGTENAELLEVGPSRAESADAAAECAKAVDAAGEALEIDASHGGQVLRTAIGLSALTGVPVSLKNIRSSRPKPGLKKQHVAAITAVVSICGARTMGVFEGSKEIKFSPREIMQKQTLATNIGSAGSVALVIQSASLPALACELKISATGGTDVAFSPPMNYLANALFPALKCTRARFSAETLMHGYFPKGRGRVLFRSKPAALPLKPLRILELGELQEIKAFSHSASLPSDVSRNQLSAAKNALANAGIDAPFGGHAESRERADTIGSGIDLFAIFSSGAVIGANALGEKGKPATRVGEEAAQNLLRELSAQRPVDSHLADQLIPYMALAKGKSEISCTSLTEHTLTNISVCEKMLGVKFEVRGSQGEPAEISVTGAGFSTKARQK